MRSYLGLALGLASAIALLVGGCSSSGTTGGPSIAAEDHARDAASSDGQIDPPPGLGAPSCDSACCASPRPVVGNSCVGTTSKEGDTCPDVIWCAPTGTIGLVLDDRELTCASGVWAAAGGSCPAPGQVNERGCPSTQPANGTACTAAEGTACHYALDCMTHGCPDAGPATVPDGSKTGTGCVEAHHLNHDDAICTGGTWSAKALPACP
ncbi:MAG: hypothetical protein JWM74_2247 [Myxococcaceae bacterium]|nr:hypothetical protein [Myxococcaceae bacterium]